MSPFELPKDSQELRLDTLALQEKILLSAISRSYKAEKTDRTVGKAVVDYRRNDRGERTVSFDLTQKDIQETVDSFRTDPKHAMAVIRNNLLSILSDPQMPNIDARKRRLERYLDTSVSLVLKLDHAAFPPQTDTEHVFRGVPEYIPDGLSDMGADPTIDPKYRNREKIRVDKEEVYRQEKDFLLELYGRLKLNNYDVNNALSLAEMKQYIIRSICNHVHSTVEYDHSGRNHPRAADRSILASEFSDKGVCRHIAMRTQLLLQIMGITSRLMKCTMDDEPHAANLVRINYDWHLIDPTNPFGIVQEGNKRLYTFGETSAPLSLQDILKGKEITVRFQTQKSSSEHKYKHRDTMYYRILRN